MTKLFFINLLVFLACSGLYASSVSQPRIDRFSGLMAQWREMLAIPGLSAALVHDGTIVWQQGFGFRDVAKRLPAGPDTQYAIASITKCMSGTLLMQLAAEGLISADTPMRQYLPQSFQDDAIKVGHVFSHSVDGPGTRFNYRADLFRLLSRVLENAGGQPLQDMFHRRIFDVLGMSRTVAGYGHPLASARLTEKALSYRRVRNQWMETKLSDEYSQFFASFGVVSSVADLALFAAALDTNTLISPEQQRDMLTPYVKASRQLPYGYGWYISRAFGETVVWHYGLLFEAYSSLLIRLPGRKLTLIVLANSDQLSTQFELHDGNLFRSPVAVGFLRLFVAEEILGAVLPGLPQTESPAEILDFVRQRRSVQPGYMYSLELFVRGLVFRSRGNNTAAQALMSYAMQTDAAAPFWLDRFNIRYFAGADSLYFNHAARQIAGNLLKRDPEDPRILFEQGLLLRGEKRMDEAVPYFEKVLKYQHYKGYADIRAQSGYYLGQYFLRADYSRAKRYLEQALATGGGSRNLRNDIQGMLR